MRQPDKKILPRLQFRLASHRHSGHAAFTNLRKRGGNLADIAVLVIDINEGIMPQTTECIEILKQYKTPFVIALNKLDLLQGWREKEGHLLNVIEEQSDSVKQSIEAKMYDIVGKLYEMGINADRFDRVSDYSKQFAIIPCAAVKGLGIPELLMVFIGLAQKIHGRQPADKQRLPGKQQCLK